MCVTPYQGRRQKFMLDGHDRCLGAVRLEARCGKAARLAAEAGVFAEVAADWPAPGRQRTLRLLPITHDYA